MFDWTTLLIVFACLAGGGVLKGATGAGAPVLAVPALAMMFDVRFAVVVMMMPNLLTNILQAWRFWKTRLPGPFVWMFALAGAVGAGIGTVILAVFPADHLSLLVALGVFGYIAARLARPDWMVALPLAERLSIPVGLTAGFLQGASGVSAPVSLTFLNAMRLDRPVFISTVSIFFVAMTLLQVPTLAFAGIMTWHGLAISFGAMLPILAFMPVGSALARRFSKETFDRAIMVLLAALALKLIYDFMAR
jgi:uncharacterized membrane protein YfcA